MFIFHRHDLCAWAIHQIYFFGHQVISGHFQRWPPKKLVGTITYEPLVGLHSNLLWLFSRYFWWSDWLLRWIHLKQNGCRSHLKQNWQGGSGGHFLNYFLILMGILPMVFVNRRGSEYFTKGVSDWNLIVLPPKKMNLDVNILIQVMVFWGKILEANPFEFFNVKCRYFCILERFFLNISDCIFLEKIFCFHLRPWSWLFDLDDNLELSKQ